MKHDLTFRYNLLAVALVFLAFWQTLLAGFITTSALMTAFSVLSPLVFLGLPLFVYPAIAAKADGKKYAAAFAECYTVKKCRGGALIFGAAAGIAGYFAYLYLYSAAVCLHEYAAEQITLFGAFSADGTYALVVLTQGVFAAAAAELMFRGGSRYSGVLGLIVPVLFGMTLGYDVDVWLKWLAVGAIGITLTRRTGSVLPAVLSSVLFSVLGMTLGNFADLPFTFRLVTSVETALYYGLMSVALGALALGGCVALCMAARGGEKREKEKLSKDDVITLVCTVVMYALLFTVYQFI